MILSGGITISSICGSGSGVGTAVPQSGQKEEASGTSLPQPGHCFAPFTKIIFDFRCAISAWALEAAVYFSSSSGSEKVSLFS